jgi:sulfatase maturation enzyme AslB (radical SAM superfamily)
MIKCVNATNGLRAYNDGSVMLCCMSKEQLTDKQGNVASVSDTPIEEIRNGTKAQEIITALANGKKHPNCERCWKEEDAGLYSKRLRDNDTFNKISDNDDALKIAELNLGTTCNLKCRICGPWSSSQWNKEFLQIGQWGSDHEEYKKWLHRLNHSYDEDSLFWDEFKAQLPNLERIEMYGGEPFLVKKQWEMLKYSIEQGYSKNQSLNFNTNGTVFDMEKVNILREFKHVHISFSIDGIEDKFEYQRHPAKWNEVIDNIKRYQYLANKYDWNLAVCITVNNYNVYYLLETMEYFDNINMEFYLNFLHDPARYSIVNLNEDIKAHLTSVYNGYKGVPHIEMWLKKAVEYMNLKKGNLDLWDAFINVTKQLDDIRSEKFEDVFPELAGFNK